MFKWIADTYYYFLWILGFSDVDGDFQTPIDREKITFMLRRSKERMGLYWWVLSLGTILGVWTLCLIASWWYLPLELFFIWLFLHVLWSYKLP
jgi:hypothetical protein